MEKKNNYKNRRTNLDDEIYLLTYTIPYYKDKLSMSIYGKKGHPTIINKLKNMAERDPPWVYIVKYDEIPDRYNLKDKNLTDKSKVLRDYVIANPEILFLKLYDRLKRNDCVLTSNEKKELKKYLISENFIMWIQSVIECSYEDEDNIFGGKIQDVFYSMINFILTECVFLRTFYTYANEIDVNLGLYENYQNAEKNFRENFETHKKSKMDYWFPLSLSLIEKLHKLDVHTANNLSIYFITFGDRVFKYYNVCKQNVLKNKESIN